MESTSNTGGDSQREKGKLPFLPFQNNSDTSKGQPDGSDAPGTPPDKRRFWLQWLIFIIIINLVFYLPLLLSSLAGQQPTISLSYTSFLQQVQQGNVKDVTLTGNTVSGDFKTPIQQKQSGTVVTYPRFTSYVPETGDTTLLPTLEKNGVQVTAQPTETPWWETALITLFNALPFLILLYLGYRYMQQSQQAGGLFGMGSMGRSKAKLYNEERPSTTFADVAGVDDAKADLREEIDFLREPQRYAALGAHIPKGVLLVGPPGTGKTLLARAVAGEAKVPFYSASGTDFVELYVGLGASRVRDLFEQAKKNSPCIIFIDEIDAIGRTRGGAASYGSNDEREQTLEQLLVAMDGFDERQEVIVLAATNRPDVLDQALLRPGRFDRQVTLGLPDRAGRLQILKVHSRGKPLDPDVDFEILARATPGFSGADLANLVNEAALSAARSGRTVITMTDFHLALDKIILGVEMPHLRSEEERRVVAYHEAGHALAAVTTEGADPVQKVTIIPRGRALGVTEQLPTDDRRNYPRSYLLGRLVVLLGGRAAEETVFHEPTTGAENDLEQATKLARHMVAAWGMVEEIGPVHFADGTGNVFLGRDLVQTHSYAEQTGAKIDQAIIELIEGAHDQARSLMINYRAALDEIVAQLLEHETVSGDDVRRIAQEHQSPQASAKSVMSD